MSDKIVSKGCFNYIVANGKASLCLYRGSKKLVTVPKTLGGYTVTSIGEKAFSGCRGLKELIIPNSVTSIGNSAFGGGLSLNLVVSSDHPVYGLVDGILFDKTTNTLNTYFDVKRSSSYIIPSFVTSIGDWVFKNCRGLREITIPNSVTSIGDGAFERCSSLREVTIPNSVTNIGDWAFEDCASLRVVTIPDSVVSIEYEAFECGIVIRGVEDSFAHRYASDKDIYFECVED